MVPNADPFDYILQDYYGMSLVPTVADMIEEAIGVIQSAKWTQRTRNPLPARKDSEITASRAPFPQHVDNGTPVKAPGLELPDKVTISWLARHVPISFWLWFVGIVVAALAAGAKFGPLMK